MPPDLFGQRMDVESHIVLSGDLLNTPEQLLLFDSLLIVHDQFEHPDDIYLYGIFDLNRQSFVHYYGREGRGPDEFYFPSLMSRISNEPDKLGIYDHRKAQFEVISLRDSILSSVIYPVDPSYANVVKQDAIITGTGFFSDGRYAVSDTLGNIMVNTGDYPFQNHLRLNNFSAGMAFQSRVAAHNSGEKFVSVTSGSGNLEIFEVTNDNEINILNRLHSYPPEFVDESRDEDFLSVTWHSDNKWGYHNLDVTDDYIYALFSGKKIGESDSFYLSDTVLVYDWKANPVTAIFLDKEVSDITVNRDNSQLYGLHMDEEGNVEVLSFTINL